MSKVKISEALRFMVDCLRAAGANQTAAQQQATLLITADKMGHPSHGMNRLEMYIKDIQGGTCKPNNKPEILKESPSTAWVDAKNVLGATASHYAMKIAIEKAKKTGVGWVCVKGSNHNGMEGYWANLAALEGLIGMAFTNTSPLMAPTRSKQSALGTNPMSVVAPGCNGDLFYLDMATTTVALGKIEMQRRKGQPIPSGWAQDPDGNQTTNAELALKTACLTPLGGAEGTSGFKGFGLAAMVELFTGVCAGSKYGHHIRKWTDLTKSAADLGHCFVAVDLQCFAPGFAERVTDLMKHWRNLDPVNPNLAVIAPGDKEMCNLEKSEKNDYVTYVEQQIESNKKLAKKLNVKPMEVMNC